MVMARMSLWYDLYSVDTVSILAYMECIHWRLGSILEEEKVDGWKSQFNPVL